MAISHVAAYAHLSEADVEALGRELDTIRATIEDSLGSRDRAYIRRTIAFQRALDVAARLVIGCSRTRKGWILGTTALAVAKSIENMEIGHNVGHGQWDWMNDPEIHSTTWEWDMAGASSQWRYSHNYTHHVYTNVLGMDDDMGFGIMRITRDETWQPKHLAQPLRNFLLAAIFEWGIALHGLHSAHDRAADDARSRRSPGRWWPRSHAKSRKTMFYFPHEWPPMAADADGQRERQPHQKPVGLCGDLLRPFP